MQPQSGHQNRELINAVANWSNLGLALDIMEPQLQVSAKNHPLDTDGCMNAMLVSWLHGNEISHGRHSIDALKNQKLDYR